MIVILKERSDVPARRSPLRHTGVKNPYFWYVERILRPDKSGLRMTEKAHMLHDTQVF